MTDSTTAARRTREGNITLAGLRAFVAVAEARSFSEGARSLGLTQPSVSVQVAALEQACGLLLCRRKPEFELTEAGRAVYVKARNVMAGVEELEGVISGAQSSAGRLVIGVSVPHVAMPLLTGFRQAYPEVGLELVMGNTAILLDRLARCQVDVGIMTLIEPNPGFDCTLLSTPRLMVCVRSDDAWARSCWTRHGDARTGLADAGAARFDTRAGRPAADAGAGDGQPRSDARSRRCGFGYGCHVRQRTWTRYANGAGAAAWDWRHAGCVFGCAARVSGPACGA